MAVNIMCVASKLWIKFGGNADACLVELTEGKWKRETRQHQKRFQEKRKKKSNLQTVSSDLK